MEIKGTLHKILPEQSGTSDKGSWKRQQFVIKDEKGKEIAFTAWGDKIEEIPGKNRIGEPITVHAFPSSKEMKNGFYNTELRLWKIDY